MHFNNFFNTADTKRFYFPGKIISGENCIEKFSDFIEINKENSLWIFIDSFFKNDPRVLRLLNKVKKCNLLITYLNGKPQTEDVINFHNTNNKNPDFIVSIGGGSVTDFAKTILASCIFPTIESININNNYLKQKIDKPLFISIPTTAGSGAEASKYYVVYNKINNKKCYGKDWNLISDYIFLDPLFLKNLPIDTLTECAFDVFIHLFESGICKYEKSNFGLMMTLFAIPKVMYALENIIFKNRKDINYFLDLLESSTIGGIAISNVRTGNIHEAAGALFEKSTLNHPQTLFVFFKNAINQYKKNILTFEKTLVYHLNQLDFKVEFKNIDNIIEWWEIIFNNVDITQNIKSKMINEIEDRKSLEKYIYDRVNNDRVWNDKESPSLNSSSDIKKYIKNSINQFLD